MSGVCVRIQVAASTTRCRSSRCSRSPSWVSWRRLPGSPAEVIGVRNLHGQVMPVIVAGDRARPAGGRPRADRGRRARRAASGPGGGTRCSTSRRCPTASERRTRPYLRGAALIDGDARRRARRDAILTPTASPGTSAMSGCDEEIHELVRQEAADCLQRMETNLLALESGEGGSDEIDAILRDAHSIKGSSAMIGWQELARRPARSRIAWSRRVRAARCRRSSPTRCCVRWTLWDGACGRVGRRRRSCDELSALDA